MAFLFDNYANKKNIQMTIIPNSITDRLLSESDVSKEVAQDELASILVKVNNLYRTKIFPAVANGIEMVHGQVEKTLSDELSIDKNIRVMNVASDILHAVSLEDTIPNVRIRPVYPVILGDVETLAPQNMKRFLDTVTNEDRDAAWTVLNALMGGNERLNTLSYGMKNSHLTQIVYALAMSLELNTAPANTRATIGNWKILVTWVKENMLAIMSKYIKTHAVMVEKDTLIHNVAGKDIFVVGDIAKKFSGLLNQGGALYNMVDIVHGAVLYGKKSLTSTQALEEVTRYQKEWDNFIKGASIAKRTSSIKHLKRAYTDLFERDVKASMSTTDAVSVRRERFETLLNALTQDELSDIESTVAKIYGEVFYPESGYLRFVGYIKAYKSMDRGFSFDDMVAMALTEMCADMIIDGCEVYENTEKFTRS